MSLPAPPPPPPPPKKKKEQVHVFYVKYKKNPHGVGKDSIIYDKPVPAISPHIPEDEEEEDEQPTPYNYHKELATAPPPPSTTLRTIIKPDSESYHSTSGIKVTFGKEGFDYDKRSSKPEDYFNTQPQPQQQQQHLQPQGRQLTSFSNAYYKTPTSNQYHTLPPELRNNDRTRPPFRPITFPISSFNKPPSSFSQPKRYPSQSHARPTEQFNNIIRQPTPQFSHSISHPAPPTFQNNRPSFSGPPSRQPVPYVPFDKFRQQHQSRPPPPIPSHFSPPHSQPVQFRPETHFPIHQQLPLNQPPTSFHSSRPSFDNSIQQDYRPEQPGPFVHKQPTEAHHQQESQFVQNQQNEVRHQPQSEFRQPPQNDFRVQSQQFQQNQQAHLQNLPNILPPGGQLIQSVPKYEQHISSLEPLSGEQSTHLGGQPFQEGFSQRLNENVNSQEQQSQRSQQELQSQRSQQELQDLQFRQYFQQHQQQQHLQQHQQQQRSNNVPHQQDDQRAVLHTTPRNVIQYQPNRVSDSYKASTSYQTTSKPSTTTTTTTQAPTPSTTTKDPKELEAQLPDEVPEDLRQQLLESGILNHADISVLDYDKVGDIPLSALPPDQLANFYGAGGGAQIGAGE